MYKVLIADDEPYIIEGLKTIINWKQYGFEIVAAAESGAEALELYEKYEPDFVMFDICMPAYTGVELAKILRARGYRNDIALLTCYSDTDYAREAIRYSVRYYFTKPINVEEIESALAEIRGKLDKKRMSSMELWEDFVPDEISDRKKEERVMVDFARILEDVDRIARCVSNTDIIGSERYIDQVIQYISEQKGQEELINIFCACLENRLVGVLSDNVNDADALFKDVTINYDGDIENIKIPIMEMCKITMNAVSASNPMPETYVDVVKKYLREHYKEDIRIKELGNILHINHIYLGVIFTKQEGMSIKNYVHSLRMKKVEELIKDEAKSLKDIAFEVGYNNYNNFFNWFERFYGTTPEEYRRNLNNK